MSPIDHASTLTRDSAELGGARALAAPPRAEARRKLLLTLHILSSVSVLGADLALIVLGIQGASGADARLIYPAAHLIAGWLIVPLATASGVRVQFKVALATMLPFEDRSFDRITSTFVMHHLSRDAKMACFAECFRVLKPGGEILVVDFGSPRGGAGRALMRLLRPIAELADNFDGLLPEMLSAAGFVEVREADRIATAFGPAIYLSGRRASA